MLKIEPRMKWYGEGEIETMKNRKLALAIIKKIQDGCYFAENHHTAKFPNTDPANPDMVF